MDVLVDRGQRAQSEAFGDFLVAGAVARPAGMLAAGWKACPTSDTTWRARKKQTTENTEDTEKTNHGEHGEGKPQRTRRTRRWKRGGGLRWSAQSCGLDGVGTPVALGIVSLCRRDRRHGKPGGLLHGSGRDWAEKRAVGKGRPGRLESRPQAGKPAPHRTRHGGHGKSKPQRTRRTRRKQTTENTENTEMEKRGRLEVERAVVRAGWRGNSRSVGDCVALPA
jgi:hypothetical protein